MRCIQSLEVKNYHLSDRSSHEGSALTSKVKAWLVWGKQPLCTLELAWNTKLRP